LKPFGAEVMFYATLMKKNNFQRDKMMLACHNQSGRSMIEMLGVLAIIGLLSIGGLAGFTEIMMQYRVNRTVEQVVEMSSYLAQIGEQSGSYNGLSNSVAVKLKAVPAGVIVNGSSLTNLFGGNITITPSGLLAADDKQAFAITYTGISQEACIRLAAQNWQSGQSGSLLGVGFAASATGATNAEKAILTNCSSSSATGNNAYVVGCAKNLPLDVASAMVGCNCSNDSCVMVAKYY